MWQGEAKREKPVMRVTSQNAFQFTHEAIASPLQQLRKHLYPV